VPAAPTCVEAEQLGLDIRAAQAHRCCTVTQQKISKRNTMPVWQCYSPKGTLTKSAKAKIADEITTIHQRHRSTRVVRECSVPRDPEGDAFVARKPSTHSYLFGAGRTRVTGQSEAEFRVALTESDPANAMEAGLILPERPRTRVVRREPRQAGRIGSDGLTQPDVPVGPHWALR
jgi:ribosomal protein L37AE/L43A